MAPFDCSIRTGNYLKTASSPKKDVKVLHGFLILNTPPIDSFLSALQNKGEGTAAGLSGLSYATMKTGPAAALCMADDLLREIWEQ